MHFDEQIARFNQMYGLPLNEVPTLLPVEKIKNFKSILSEEIEEIDDIVSMYEENASAFDVLTAVADLLGDVIVYCRTMAQQFGLPMNEVLDVIMRSNFSKLGEDGEPIFDERGKVMKGPGYWKPEPEIKALLERHARTTG